jgi:Cof subfamily protein (haloacid dehalogenase superfamily)
MAGSRPIRLVALDLDGTTLNSAGLLSPRTTSVLQRLSTQSVHIVAATGRSPSYRLREICRPGLFGWAICSNGATLHDIDRDVVVSATRIPETVLTDMCTYLATVLPAAALAWGTAGQIHWTCEFDAVYGSVLDRQPILEGGSEFPDGVVKVLVGDRHGAGTEVARLLAQRFGGSVQLTTTGLGYVEVVAGGVTKAARLAELCRSLGVSASETLAFGDGLNDLDLLRWAGHSYAMAGAPPDVNAAARQRTRLSHDDDGVADVLDELFPADGTAG